MFIEETFNRYLLKCASYYTLGKELTQWWEKQFHEQRIILQCGESNDEDTKIGICLSVKL